MTIVAVSEIPARFIGLEMIRFLFQATVFPSGTQEQLIEIEHEK